MTKKVHIIAISVLLSAFFLLAGCDKGEEWTQVTLDESELTELTVSPAGEPAYVRIDGGSGEYSVVIDEEEIADVSIDFGYLMSAGLVLVIEPKTEGDAVITVTDKKSGLFARCQLTVAMFTTTFQIDAVRVNVDADRPDEIEADLEADVSVPAVGGAIRRNFYDPAGWAFVDADGKEIARGIITEEEFSEWNPAFDFLQPDADSQPVSYFKWILNNDGGDESREFDVFICKGKFTRASLSPSLIYHFRFYEDLTEYYKTKFPDAGIGSVARVLISNTF